MKTLSNEEIFALPDQIKVMCRRNGATPWICPDLRDGEVYEASRWAGVVFEITFSNWRQKFIRLNEPSEHLVLYQPGKLTQAGWFELVEDLS